jgi:hypothetical protein
VKANPFSRENFAASLKEAAIRAELDTPPTTVRLDSGNLYDPTHKEFWLLYPTGDRAIIVPEALFYERIGRAVCRKDGTDILREDHEHAFYIATIPLVWEEDINGTTIREVKL